MSSLIIVIINYYKKLEGFHFIYLETNFDI